MTLKEKLHQLIDDLPRRELTAAERYLEHLRDEGVDPVIEAMLRAPIDDEPLTEREEREIEKGRRDVVAGRTISHAALRRRFRK
jgi:hypothetical protein